MTSQDEDLIIYYILSKTRNVCVRTLNNFIFKLEWIQPNYILKISYKLKHCTSLSQENKTLLTDQYWLTRGKGNTQKFTRYVGWHVYSDHIKTIYLLRIMQHFIFWLHQIELPKKPYMCNSVYDPVCAVAETLDIDTLVEYEQVIDWKM